MVGKDVTNAPAAVRREIILIDQLVLDPTFQVRNRLNEPAITRYKEAYRINRKLPPIRAAEVDGMLIVVDGWHRVRALQQLGRLHVDVEIEPVSSKADALWVASIANVNHGVPLSRQEEVNVFRNYVATGKHVKGGGMFGVRYKNYRDMADELPISRSHVTIHNWMKKYFPEIAKAIGGESTESDVYEGERHASPPEHDDTASNLTAELLTHFQSISDPQQRGIIIGEVRGLLQRLEAARGWIEPPPPDEPEF